MVLKRLDCYHNGGVHYVQHIDWRGKIARRAMPTTISVLNRCLIAAGVAVALLSLLPAPAHARCSKSVVLYSAYWCPYCKQVRDILARNEIKYALLDATSTNVQAMMRKRFGDTAVPRTVIGGVVVEGVDEERIKQLCRQDQDAPTSTDIMLPDFPPSPGNAETRLVARAIRFRG
jgi:glutaredoxin